jgi:hypothetical protein
MILKITMLMECAKTATTKKEEQKEQVAASTQRDAFMLKASVKIAISVYTISRRGLLNVAQR